MLKKAWEKRNIFHILRFSTVAVPYRIRYQGKMALRFAADNRQQRGGVYDASVSGSFFGLGEDAEYAGHCGQAVHIASGGFQCAPGF